MAIHCKAGYTTMVNRVDETIRLIIICLTALGCGPKSNLLEVGSLHSDKLEKDMDFSVLRAPAPTRPGIDPKRLPVVLFLHGMGSDNSAFDEFGVSDEVFSAMVKGQIPLAHLVFPNGERGFYLNWYDGTHPYEDYILKEVLPKAELLLGVDKSAPRHIAGVSMGGIGALQIGLRNSTAFSSVSCISGMILNKSEAEEMMHNPLIRMFAPIRRIWGDGTDDAFSDGINPYKLVAHLKTPLKIFLAAGTGDRDKIQETTKRFHHYLQQKSVSHRYEVFHGDHTWSDWIPVIKQAISEVLF